MGSSIWGQIQGAGGPSAGLSGLQEQGLDELIRGNSSTGQYLEQGHQRGMGVFLRSNFVHKNIPFFDYAVHGLDKSRVKSCPMQLGSCSQSLM